MNYTSNAGGKMKKIIQKTNYGNAKTTSGQSKDMRYGDSTCEHKIYTTQVTGKENGNSTPTRRGLTVRAALIRDIKETMLKGDSSHAPGCPPGKNENKTKKKQQFKKHRDLLITTHNYFIIY